MNHYILWKNLIKVKKNSIKFNFDFFPTAHYSDSHAFYVLNQPIICIIIGLLQTSKTVLM